LLQLRCQQVAAKILPASQAHVTFSCQRSKVQRTCGLAKAQLNAQANDVVFDDIFVMACFLWHVKSLEVDLTVTPTRGADSVGDENG